MNIINKGKKLLAAAGAMTLSAAAMAQATDPITTLFDAIDLSGVAVKVVAAGVLVLGIALAFKGVDLGKRTTRKV